MERTEVEGGDTTWKMRGCTDSNNLMSDYMKLSRKDNVVVLKIDCIQELMVNNFKLKNRYKLRNWDEDDQIDCEDEDNLFVWAAICGSSIFDFDIKRIDWRKQRKRFIRNASGIPRKWFGKNCYIHEVALWKDATVINAYHAESIGM